MTILRKVKVISMKDDVPHLFGVHWITHKKVLAPRAQQGLFLWIKLPLMHI
jgi:hypothetical protein